MKIIVKKTLQVNDKGPSTGADDDPITGPRSKPQPRPKSDLYINKIRKILM